MRINYSVLQYIAFSMISQKNASFLFLFICFSAIFVFFAFFRTEYRYDYAHYEKKIKSSFNGV